MSIVKVRKVAGHPGYFVSKCGKVFSTRQNKWKELRLGICPSSGYLMVGLASPVGLAKFRTVHSLVIEAWGPPRPSPLHEVRHFPDRTKTNNHISNLQWGTRKENSADREHHGTVIRGEDHKGSVWTAKQVRLARKLSRRCGGTLCDREVARRFGVSEETVRRAVMGDTWAHLGTPTKEYGRFPVPGKGRPLSFIVRWTY